MLRRLTRREAANFLTQQGYPTSIHSLNRLCAPAVNLGPLPDGRWGNRDIYTEPTLLEWAQLRSESQRDRPRHGGNPAERDAKVQKAAVDQHPDKKPIVKATTPAARPPAGIAARSREDAQ